MPRPAAHTYATDCTPADWCASSQAGLSSFAVSRFRIPMTIRPTFPRIPPSDQCQPEVRGLLRMVASCPRRRGFCGLRPCLSHSKMRSIPTSTPRLRVTAREETCMRTRTTRCLTGRLTGLTAALILTSTLSAAAQTPYIPYFGKNQIRYDNFQWHIYTTDHFEIYYYPEIEPHLERMAGYAESAYQHDQLRAEARPRVQGAADPVPDEQRVPAAERHPRRGAGRRRRVRRADPPAHRDADGRAAGSALPADRPRADAPVRVRHHPARR